MRTRKNKRKISGGGPDGRIYFDIYPNTPGGVPSIAQFSVDDKSTLEDLFDTCLLYTSDAADE